MLSPSALPVQGTSADPPRADAGRPYRRERCERCWFGAYQAAEVAERRSAPGRHRRRVKPPRTSRTLTARSTSSRRSA